MPGTDELTLARLIGNIYTEVFQRRPYNPNKRVHLGIHRVYEQPLSEKFKSRLIADANVDQWGPGGVSDETDGTPSAARWGFTGRWG